MKPSFALNLTSETIGLLHRTPDGWDEVGSTRFDSADLADRLAALREAASGLEPDGVMTKVVIPNSQILYTEIAAPGPDRSSRRAQIMAGLEGLTPYDVADLVYDWTGSGETVKVAVVARETLQEAEAFAEEHGFKPLCFVAVPEPARFGKEPWFGVTSGAGKWLSKGQKVERGGDPIILAAPATEGAAETALPEPDVSKPVAGTAEAPPVEVAMPSEAALPDPQPAALPPQSEEQPIPGEVATLPPAPPSAEPEPLDDAPELPIFAPDPVATEPEPEPDLFVPPPLARSSDKPIPHARDLPPFAPPPAPAIAEPVTTAPPPPRSQPSVAATDIPEAPFVDLDDDIPDMPAGAFASRRAPETGAGAASPKPAARPADPVVQRPAAPRPASAKPFGAGPVQSASPPRPPVSVTAPNIPGPKNRKAKPAQPPAPPPRPPLPASSPAKGNSLGSFGSRQLPQRGKPRFLGLILTVVLLLVLAAVAAWSSYYIASMNSGEPEAVVAGETPGVDDEMLADMQDPADLAEAEPETAALPDADVVEPQAAPETEVPAPVLTEDSSATDAAVAEALQTPAPAAEAPQVAEVDAAPEGSLAEETQDEIFLTAMDKPQPTLDAVALPPPPAAPDTAPEAQITPPPFGAVYSFDANGMIQPTEEGVVAPGGFLLVAGPPPLLPQPRPEAALPEPDAAATVTDAAAPPATTPGAIFATNPPAAAALPEPDPALAGVRPRQRPADLAPPPATAEDDAALAEPEPTQQASLRPRARPAGAEPVVQPAAAASLMAAGLAPAPRPDEIPEAIASNNGAISPLALTVSRKPAPRPSDFSQAIEAAVAAVVRTPEVPQVRVAPEEENEPEVVAAVAPKIPTRANVAKQATFANAINLSRLNLIGVYGTSSNRYALVRQSNGRYVKLRVGDRLDGGTVAAITSDELRYKKGSRMLSLEMPQG